MPQTRSPSQPLAHFAGWTGRHLRAVSNDLSDLDRGGRWAVCVTFEGDVTLARFDSWTQGEPDAGEIGEYRLPTARWSDSLARDGYERAVQEVRRRIGLGDVYQVNVCRVLSAPAAPDADAAALWRRLAAGNPAPYGGFLRLPGLSVASASPELFLRRRAGVLASGPIKGTAGTAYGFSDKDRAENLMIVDLVRNDLGRVCRTGTVRVPALMSVEPHPGLFHLVSTVSGDLNPGVGWREILEALFPPGSVSGAPKLAALEVIRELEPVRRGPYCGAFGWVDADQGTAELAVAIRTFWFENGRIHFGTGAGITWGSDPAAEWQETELKARRLLGIAGAAGDSRGAEQEER